MNKNSIDYLIMRITVSVLLWLQKHVIKHKFCQRQGFQAMGRSYATMTSKIHIIRQKITLQGYNEKDDDQHLQLLTTVFGTPKKANEIPYSPKQSHPCALHAILLHTSIPILYTNVVFIHKKFGTILHVQLFHC